MRHLPAARLRLLLRVMMAFAFLLIGNFGQSQAQGPAKVKAFVGARLIDDSNRPAIDNAVLVVRDGRVIAAGPASRVRPPAGAEIINLAGKFIIPGLISAHVHVSDVQGTRPPAYTEENTLRQLGIFARYGITAVQSLGGEQAPAFKARAAQNAPRLDHARLFVAGEIIVGKTPEEARQMVARVAAAQPDIIK